MRRVIPKGIRKRLWPDEGEGAPRPVSSPGVISSSCMSHTITIRLTEELAEWLAKPLGKQVCLWDGLSASKWRGPGPRAAANAS